MLSLDPADDLLVFENQGDAEATGGEIQVEGRWQSGWAGSLSYSHQYGKNKETGERLVNSPRNTVKANLMFPLLQELLMGGVEAQYVDGRKTLSGGKTDDIFLTNLTVVSKGLVNGMTLSASLYNLFDEDYSYPGSSEHYQDAIGQDGLTFRLKLDYLF